MMDLIGWMVGGILVLGMVRLILAIYQTRNVNRANRMITAQGIRWNQMCEDVTQWLMGLEGKEEKKEEGRSAFCLRPETPCSTHEAILPCEACRYFIDADFNLRKQFYEESKDFIKNAEDGSKPYDPHN